MANEAIVSSIEKLESSLNNKYENTIYIVSETTDIRQKLETPIKLDPSKNYKIAIKYFTYYNLIDNITCENNEFHYKLNDTRHTTNLNFDVNNSLFPSFARAGDRVVNAVQVISLQVKLNQSRYPLDSVALNPQH